MAFTYNDPMIFLEYAIDVADACRARGIKAVAVTAGYICPTRRGGSCSPTSTPRTSTSRRSPRTSTTTSAPAHLQPVLDTLVYLRHETDVWFEITTLLIPGHNDSDAEIDAECAWIAEHLGADVPLHFTAFHPDFKMLDVPPTPPATLRRARRDRAGQRAALRLHRQRPRRRGRPDHAARAAAPRWSSATGTRIGRYRLTDDGRCAGCGTALPGRFDGPVERWGPRRVPVSITSGIRT